MSRAVGSRTAVVTVTHRRDRHLHRQRLALAAEPPGMHVVVGMDDVPRCPQLPGCPAPVVAHVGSDGGGLPLARARNTGARLAVEAGADVLVFLDVDCIPSPQLMSRYRRAAATVGPPAVLSGPVAYLPPPPAGGYPATGLETLASPHPARPAPPDGEVVDDARVELFWSLSFCVTATTWAYLGGFDEAYAGYGAEDTDFAVTAKRSGATFHWVGGALAFHQHHEPSRTDPTHIPAMVRNARLFHDKHGWWPMGDWLSDLAARGLILFRPAAGVIDLPPGAPGGAAPLGAPLAAAPPPDRGDDTPVVSVTFRSPSGG